MKAKFCFWTVVDGAYSEMFQGCIRSAREAGVFAEFHAWTDRNIADCVCHALGPLEKACYLFKFSYLREHVSKLKYEYLVWLDADSYFVRHPGDILSMLHGAPIHSSLESDACSPTNVRPDWWGCPLGTYARMMQERGVFSRRVFNVNAGLWIVHHDVIETLCDLALDFWHFSKSRGFAFTEEAPLAYATHMLCGDPELHTLRNNAGFWASDWTGQFREILPDGQPWWFSDYFSGELFAVNPAIVHAMRSKRALIEHGQTVAT